MTIPTTAQELGGFYSGMAFNGIVTNQTAITQASIGNELARELQIGADRPELLPLAPSASVVKSRYSPLLERRSANLARFVQKSGAADPRGAAEMEKLFAGTDVIAEIGRAIAPVGLRTDDVADAYAVWWMSAWQAAHGDASTPGRTTAQAVRAQAARALAATPEFGRADDAMKQEFAEALLVQTALIDGIMEEYGSDPAMAPKIAASVRQGARASGLDLDAMTLTEAGFVPVR